MDGKRFDEIAASLTNASSRRGVLRGVAAGGVASALAAVGLGLNEADARHHRHKRRHHKRKNKALTISQTLNGLLEGSLCKKSKQCDAGLVCGILGDNKKRCHTCGVNLGCPAGKCCLVGACVAGLDICVVV